MAHTESKPIFVTKNGAGDLAIMSMEVYDRLTRRADLVKALEVGHEDVEAGRTTDALETLGQLKREFE